VRAAHNDGGAATLVLDLGDPGDDALLADLQDEARNRLPVADLMHRVMHRVAVTAKSLPTSPRSRFTAVVFS